VKKILVLLFILFAAPTFAQQGWNQLDSAKVSQMWSQFRPQAFTSKADSPSVFKNSNPDIPPAVIEIVPGDQYGRSYNVVFRSNTVVPRGTTISFRIALSNGSTMDLSGFLKDFDDNSTMYFEMWNGPFPGIWPGGFTLFEVALAIPGQSTAYILSPVGVWCRGCLFQGFLDRADVSQDGTVITLQGSLSGQLVATLDGVAVDVVTLPAQPPSPFLPSVGMPERKVIYTDKVGNGQVNLTLCSDGFCFSRFVYLPPRPNQGGGGKV